MTTNNKYYLRFTETIEEDIERGTSILTNHDNEIVDGLCAFGPFDSFEKLEKHVMFWFNAFPEEHSKYAVLTGTENPFGKKGSLGTVIRNIEIVKKVSL